MRIVIVATGSWGDVRPSVVLGHALQKAGYEVVLVASRRIPRMGRGTRRGLRGFSFNIQAVLDAQTNNSNPLQTMRWMRQVAEATVQMGVEIADVIQPGDVVLLNEGVFGLVNGALEKHNNRFIHINLQPWVPTVEFSGMVPAPPAWMPFEGAYNRLTGGFVRRGQWLTMGESGNQVRTEHLGLPKQTWAKHHAMLNSTPSLLLVSPHVLPPPADWQPHHRITGYVFDDDGQWEAPQDLLDFLAAGDKPAYIGFGSMHERNPEEATRLLAGCRKAKWKARHSTQRMGRDRRVRPAERCVFAQVCAA